MIMGHVIPSRKPSSVLRPLARGMLPVMLTAGMLCAQRTPQRPVRPAPNAARTATPPQPTYWVYVGAESADRIYRVQFGAGGATVEKTIRVGELAAEMEGPHGLQISPDGKWLYMTTGHGTPDGKLWKYDLGPDTLVGPGISLGKFPASLDVTPDGLYSFSANFNLHGEMVPSSISVVYTPTMTEVAQVETCTMPHGSRIEPGGTMHYSGCMMDDQLVEIDTRSFAVTRRFSLAKGKEGPLATTMAGHDMHAMHGAAAPAGTTPGAAPPASQQMDASQGHGVSMSATCSPTWAQPSADGRVVYVACNKADEIVEVERAGWSITRRIATGRGPYNLAVTPDGKYMVATLKQSAGIEIFELAMGRSVARLPTSTTVAHGVAISPDSRFAFVSSEGVGAQPGKVDVYDIAARARVATVDVGQQASGITFWKMDPAPRR
jgi:DNA-binding beta-propeller fold protein YncE